jgi:hypothetical protein
MKQESSYKILSEELEIEIFKLKKLIEQKQELLEEVVGGLIEPAEKTQTTSSGKVPVPNTGGVAGTYSYLDIGGASDAMSWNSGAAASALKGQGKPGIVPGTDIRVVPNKPHYTNNIGSGMGFGVDDGTFARARNFIAQYSDSIPETDDPEQDVKIGWKNLNQAVSNYVSQNLKQSLAQAGLFAGQDMAAPYQQGLPDAYSRYVPDLALNKKLQDNVDKVMGTKFRGAEVAKKLKMATREKLLNTWLNK